MERDGPSRVTAECCGVSARAVRAVFAHEWRVAIYSARTFTIQACMLVALAAAVFQVGGLYDSDYASLDLVWTFLPIVAIVFVPAFGARAFAHEEGSREYELMQSLPLSDLEIVLGKWLAGVALLCVTLAFASPIALTVAYLGSPDWGQAASGLLGAVLFLATCYAVTMLCSALVREQGGAYVLSVIALGVLVVLGWSTLTDWLGAPAAIVDALHLLSPKVGAARLASGRIETVALFSFLFQIAAALTATILVLRWRRAGAESLSRLARHGAYAGAAALIGVALLAAGARWGGFLDATSEELFTASDTTMELARAAPPGTTIDFYWSESEASVPASLRAHAHRVRDLLELICGGSGGRLKLSVHDTQPDSEAEWNAVAAGMRRVPLSSGGSFFIGLVLRSGARAMAIPYLDETVGERLEYELAVALSRIGQERLPKVGVLSALIAPSAEGEGRSQFAFLDAIKRSADVAVIPFFANGLPDDLDVLVVVGGAPMKKEMLRAIDRHVMRGKGLVVLLDPLTRFNATGKLVSASATPDLNTIADLVARYGIAFDAHVVGDPHLAAEVASGTGERFAYPFWMRTTAAQLSKGSPATYRLQNVLFLEPGSLALSQGARALVTTTANSGVLPAGELPRDSIVGAAKLKPDGKVRVLAASVTGALPSAFDTAAGEGEQPRARQGPGAPVFVVADVDWILDQAAVADTGGQAPVPVNDNLALLANMIDVAAGDQRLMAIRARGNISRRFTRVAELLQSSQQRYGARVAEAQAKVEKVDTTIAKILKATNARSVADLPEGVRSGIAQLYASAIPYRKVLRDVHFAMRRDVERLGWLLLGINLVSGPLLAFVFFLAVAWNRSGTSWMRRRRRLPKFRGTAERPL